MPSLCDLIVDDSVERLLAENGQPRYRAGQIRRWMLSRRAADWREMTDLPAPLREQLAGQIPFWTTTVAKHTQSADGTEKLLLSLAGGGEIECVLLRDQVRRTVCISTQVGCAMGCVFCASGLDGVERNLSPGEILEQILRLDRLLSTEERLSHIVMMGMGEPLANLDAMLAALDVASSSTGLGISARRITISTVGLPPAIRRLAEIAPRYRLAVSLHAPNDELRTKIVPINKNISLAAILDAADSYYAESGRQMTFEYVLLADLNDRQEHAHQLVQLLAGRPVMVNVIPYNPVAGLPYRTPSSKAQEQFRSILEQSGVRVKFRHRKGDKIDAACGQLRRSAAAPETLISLTPNN